MEDGKLYPDTEQHSAGIEGGIGGIDSDLANDPDMQGLSLLEKKSLLVNRELDSMGMGRYQWMIWSLCGLGYMIDLLWAQAFGLVSPALQAELGFSGK